MNRINYEYCDSFSYGRTFYIYVYVPSFIEEIKMKIPLVSQTDTVRNVIQRICRKKGIETTRDLVLVLSSPK